MSISLKKLIGNLSGAKFKLVILSEGYTSSQEAQFYQEVFELWDKITNYYPFTSLRNHNSTIGVGAAFIPSPNSSYATSATTAVGFNNFETYFDSVSETLNTNPLKVDEIIEDCIIEDSQGNIDLKDLVFKDILPMSIYSTLVLILIPSAANIVAETEYRDENHYYHIASTNDGYVEQLVIRTIAKIIGLGDEFEVAETPNADVGKAIEMFFPNLIYLNSPLDAPSASDDNFKWRQFFRSSVSTSLNIVPNSALNVLQSNQVSYDDIQLIEGGGQCQYKIYRAFPDCLLRRSVGNILLSVKEKKISLCNICSVHIQEFIK